MLRQEAQRRATEQQRALAHTDVEGSKARCASLAGFVREAWHVLQPTTPYVHNWHIDAICLHLEAITRGRLLALGLENRLLINVPPGTMKSLLVAVFWPAFEWGPAGMPGLSYLTSSFSAANVDRDAGRMRDLVASEWFQARWPVRLLSEARTNFENEPRGKREGRAFGSLTGGRGDRVIIDDPHSTETAESEAQRATAIRILRESLPSRTNDLRTSAIIVIMQRLHEGDVAGTILRMGLPYTHLMLPMRFDPARACRTPLGFVDPRTSEDELLFPEKFPRNLVDQMETAMTAYAVAGQHQQLPGPREGGMFKREWFKVARELPARGRTVRGWDLAATESGPGKQPAYTAGVRLTHADGKYYIDHVVRLRGSPAAVVATLKQTSDVDRAKFRRLRISIPQDPGQSGKAQCAAFMQTLDGLPVRFSPESGSKVDRADPVSAQAEAGNFYVVVTGDAVADAWIEPFLAEVEMFPGRTHKDQVDALSRAFSALLAYQRVDDDDDVVPMPIQAGKGEQRWSPT